MWVVDMFCVLYYNLKSKIFPVSKISFRKVVSSWKYPKKVVIRHFHSVLTYRRSKTAFNRVLKFLSSQPKSKTIAKNRLQLILIQDRLGINACVLETLRSDLISLLSKYFEIINDSEVEIKLLRGKKQIAFVANASIANLRQTPTP